MIREQEILREIAEYGADPLTPKLSPEKLAAYLARMESPKSEDGLVEWNPLVERWEKARKERLKNRNHPYPPTPPHIKVTTPPSEEKKCCGAGESCSACPSPRKDDYVDFLVESGVPGYKAIQEDAPKKRHPFATIVNKYGSGFFWYEETEPMDELTRVKFFGEIIKTLDELPSPTPPDAWDEEEFKRVWHRYKEENDVTVIEDWLRSKKKEWEVRAQMKCSNTNHTFLEEQARTTTLEEVERVVEDFRREIPWDYVPPKSAAAEAKRQYERQNAVIDRLLSRLREMRTSSKSV